MNLLKAALYDPAVAVSKVTTAALAMTALDTVNLRLAITVPAHGMVRFKLSGVIHGAATFPSILLGVMNGATVLGRVAPAQVLGNTAVATALLQVLAEFTVTGLAPGAMNVDAAYGVETLVAATGLKYGGPNNTTANDAFGAFVFEAWDPQPQTANSTLAVDANGRVDLSKVLGGAINALVAGRMDASVGAMAANVLTAAAINAAALNGKGDWNIGKTGYALAAAEYTALVNSVWDELTSEGRTAGSYGQKLKDLLVDGSGRVTVGALLAGVITNAAFAVDAIDALAIKADAGTEIADALLDRASAAEGFTVRQLLRLFFAALCGKADGFPLGPVHMRDAADTKNRITATIDITGNRTVIVLDAS